MLPESTKTDILLQSQRKFLKPISLKQELELQAQKASQQEDQRWATADTLLGYSQGENKIGSTKIAVKNLVNSGALDGNEELKTRAANFLIDKKFQENIELAKKEAEELADAFMNMQTTAEGAKKSLENLGNISEKI